MVWIHYFLINSKDNAIYHITVVTQQEKIKISWRYVDLKYTDGNTLMMASELTKRSPVKILSALLLDILILCEIMFLYKEQPTTGRYLISTGNTFLNYQLLSFICCWFGCAFLILSVLLPHFYMKRLTNPQVTAREKLLLILPPLTLVAACSNVVTQSKLIQQEGNMFLPVW